MSTLIPAMVATAILGVVIVPIVNLSLETVKTRVDSELFSEAETRALGVRRQAAQADSLAISQGSLVLTTNNVAGTVTLPQGCSVATSTSDPDFASVTCTASRGSRSQRNIQPLFSRTDLMGSSSGNDVCYTRYQGQNNSNRGNPKGTYTATVEVINEIIAASGNSGGFIQIHRITDAACEGARDASLDDDRKSSSQANSTQTPSQPATTPPTTPETTPQNCTVPNLVNKKYKQDALPSTWNTKNGGISSWPSTWSGNREVTRQNPPANSAAPCNSTLSLTLG